MGARKCLVVKIKGFRGISKREGQKQAIIVSAGYGDVSAVLQDPIGASLFEVATDHGGEKSNYSSASGLARVDSSRRIFHHNAIGRGKAELRRRFQIRFGIGLADLHVARRNHILRDG